MSFILSELLKIQKGTLFTGLKTNSHGHISISTDGWGFEEKRIVKDIWLPSDHSRFLLTLYADCVVQKLLEEEKIEICNNENLSYSVLRKNASAFDPDLNYNSHQKSICEGDTAGMSLGENFCTLSPTTANIYRPDFYKIFIMHRLLLGDEIFWVAFQTKHLTKDKILFGKAIEPMEIDIRLL